MQDCHGLRTPHKTPKLSAETMSPWMLCLRALPDLCPLGTLLPGHKATPSPETTESRGLLPPPKKGVLPTHSCPEILGHGRASSHITQSWTRISPHPAHCADTFRDCADVCKRDAHTSPPAETPTGTFRKCNDSTASSTDQQ